MNKHRTTTRWGLQSHKQTPQLLEFREAGPVTPYNNLLYTGFARNVPPWNITPIRQALTLMDVAAHNQQISGLFGRRHLPIKLKYTIRQTIFFWNPRCWPLSKSASIGDLMPVHRNYPFSSGSDRKWIDTGLPMFLAHRKQLNRISNLNTSTNRFWWHRWRRTNHWSWPNHCTRRLWLGITPKNHAKKNLYLNKRTTPGMTKHQKIFPSTPAPGPCPWRFFLKGLKP